MPIILNPSGGLGDTGLSDGNRRSKNVGAIAGLVVVGVITVAAIFGAIYFFIRRRRLGTGNVFAQREGRSHSSKRSSEAILEPFAPMSQLSTIESQRTLSTQMARFKSPASLRQSYEPSTESTPSSLGSPMVSDVSLGDFPPMNSAVLEKQRQVLFSIEDTKLSDSMPSASVSSRAIGSSTEGHSNPIPVSGARDANPDLRLEVEDLRREIERIRQERGTAQEAPPMYDSILEREGL